ncbi:hypothetical protein AURDEDRAFT_174124 [Auricularia subglabra TFB-10046 SS5]|nr:hypothetical protein AURDEDRAFT_174124 [Auricularia subglabra TFB-10046 SS5]
MSLIAALQPVRVCARRACRALLRPRHGAPPAGRLVSAFVRIVIVQLHPADVSPLPSLRTLPRFLPSVPKIARALTACSTSHHSGKQPLSMLRVSASCFPAVQARPSVAPACRHYPEAGDAQLQDGTQSLEEDPSSATAAGLLLPVNDSPTDFRRCKNVHAQPLDNV